MGWFDSSPILNGMMPLFQNKQKESQMQFTDANTLIFVQKGQKTGSLRKRSWMASMNIGDAKTYKTSSKNILRNVRAQVSRFNKQNGKTLSVRTLQSGGFAVIRKA